MDTPAKKELIDAPQQKLDTEVMGAMKQQKSPEYGDDVTQNLGKLKKMLSDLGITVENAIKLGKMAEAAIKDPAMYRPVIDMATKEGLIPPGSLPIGQGINYKLLSQVAVIGKAAESLTQPKG